MALLLAVAAAVGAAATAQAATGGYGPYPPSPPSPPPAAPAPATHMLSVAKAGSGTGSVTSTPAGIACGADCDETFASGASVTLSAAPDAGASFAGWGGACSGSGSCTLSMDTAKSVTATFALDNAQVAAPQDTALRGSVAKVKLVVRSGRRIARSSLALSEAVRAELRLVRRGRVLASKRVDLGAGRRHVALRIPARVAGGRATLRIVLEDAAGNSKATARRLRIPSA